MTKKLANSLFLICFLLMGSMAMAQDKAEQLGWKLGAQAYTFNRFTLAEALDKIDSCGLKYVECYPGQKIGGGIEGTMDFKMDAATRAKVLGLIKSKGLTLIAYGVVVPSSPADWRKLFEFAKAMGIEVINSEPKDSDLDLVSSLCDEFKIHLAMHDHPKPSHYWHPDSVLVAIKGRSQYMGSCADIGHWVRSGLDPIECLKKLKGHVFSMHFKDLNEKSRRAHDVIWNTGTSNIPAIMATMKEIGFKGPISAEYEYHWDNSVPEVKQSVANFRSLL